MQATEDYRAADAASTEAHVVVERPPPGLARGRYEWPAWGIGVLGASVVVLGGAFIIWRLLYARRRSP